VLTVQVVDLILNGLKFENTRYVSSVTAENNSFVATNTFTNNEQ
jgi:hypothetical protein